MSRRGWRHYGLLKFGPLLALLGLIMIGTEASSLERGLGVTLIALGVAATCRGITYFRKQAKGR